MAVGWCRDRELVELYARRWDHELFYRNLKHQLRKSELLQSHTLETRAQEIGALMLAAALVAQERVRLANGEVPVLSVSFIKLVDLLRPLWLVLALGRDILEDWQKQALTERFYAQARRVGPRRGRARPVRERCANQCAVGLDCWTISLGPAPSNMRFA